MFNIFKRKEETPVVEIQPNGVDALRTEDGGYLGPGVEEDGALPMGRRNNYQSTQALDTPTPRLAHRTAPSLNTTNDPQREGSQPPKGWEDESVSASSVQTNLDKQKCGNPDYELCGGCCYPFSCFGFGSDQKLVLLSIGVFAILIGLIIGIVLILTTFYTPRTLCMTPECVVAAGEIITAMDQTVDPCEDFVDFTCGGWKRMNPVPDGMGDKDNFGVLNERTYFKLKELLEEPPLKSDPKAVKQAKIFYKACTNETAWGVVGVFPLLKEIERIGGFPMINTSWTNDTFNWLSSTVTMRQRYAADYLLQLRVSYDSKNSSLFVLHIGEGLLPSPRELIVTNDTYTRKREMDRILEVAQFLGSALDHQEQRRLNPLSMFLNKTLKTISLGNSNHENMFQRSENEENQKENDTFMDLFLSQKDHLNRMQMRKSDRVIVLDGISPSTVKMANFEDKKKVKMDSDGFKTQRARKDGVLLQRQSEETEKTNSTMSGKQEEAQIISDVNDLWDFIYFLSNISMPSEKQKDLYGQYNPMTIKELQTFTDELGDEAAKINWLDYINSAFSETKLKLDESQRIIVTDPSYLVNVLILIKKTPSRVIANYLSYMLSLNMGEEVSLPGGYASFSDTPRTYQQRWYSCSTKTNMVLTGAVTYLYVRDSFNKDSIKSARLMVSDVQKAFKDILEETSWMDEETTEAGMEKLDSMLDLIGYGPSATNATQLDEDYQEVPELYPNDHFGNIMKLARYLSNKSLSVLSETPERDMFTMSPVTINAAYSFPQNAMLIPAGILQSPFFRRNTVPALNYGGLGVVIGHEITHGFDDAGREVDSEGNLRQWWTNSSKKTYEDRAECFKEQYGRFPLPEDITDPEEQNVIKDAKVNGGVTMGENIADNGGMRAAFRGFQRRLKESKDEPQRLPGLEHFTPEQLFFISFAQVWCTNYTPMGLKAALLLGAHAPGPFRVKGSFENNAHMRATFRCNRLVSDGFDKVCKLW